MKFRKGDLVVEILTGDRGVIVRWDGFRKMYWVKWPEKYGNEILLSPAPTLKLDTVSLNTKALKEAMGVKCD